MRLFSSQVGHSLSEVSGGNALAQRPERNRSLRRLPQHSISNVLVPLSQAIDLAEGRAPGHAQRVAFISMAIAEALGMEKEAQLSACYAGLLHDLGVVAAGADIAGSTSGDERLVFASLPLLTPDEALAGSGDSSYAYVERVAGHVDHGSRSAQFLGLSEEVARAIAAHHETWDGEGYPDGLIGPETPMIGRIVGLADHTEALISQNSPLLARRNFGFWMSNAAGTEADPEIVHVLAEMGSGDSFWLGLCSDDLISEITERCSRLRETRGANLLPLAEGFARLVDSRFSFKEGVSARVARYAEPLGKAAGLSDLDLKKLRIAALLHDVGELSMSERVLSKPGILSVEEMGALHLHPIYSSDVVRGIPGLEEVAEWVTCHHERMDGRGYPEGREGNDIPLQSRILAIADAYVAITSDRPHRPRVSGKEAQARLQSAAGTQLDSDLVDLFLTKIVSSRNVAA
jgi:HD-GYP domain-containing protein (c-di-GMP phosphodiesterase class II)